MADTVAPDPFSRLMATVPDTVASAAPTGTPSTPPASDPFSRLMATVPDTTAAPSAQNVQDSVGSSLASKAATYLQDTSNAAVGGYEHGLSLGMFDRAGAAATAGLKYLADKLGIENQSPDFQRDYSGLLHAMQQDRADAEAKAPVSAFGGEVLGNARAITPVLEGAGTALSGAVNKLGPVGTFLSGNAGKAPGAVNRLASYASRGANTAIQGAGAAGLASGESDEPIGTQIERGAVMGGVLGAGAPLVGDVARSAGGVAKGLVQPFTEKGQNAIADKVINKFAQGGPTTVNDIALVPGSSPTLAQATANPGLATLERAVRDARPNPFLEKSSQNASARENFLEGLSGTPQTLDALVQNRSDTALQKLDAALSNAGEANPASVDRTIKRILSGPSGQRDAVANALTSIQSKLTLDNPLTDRIAQGLAPIKSALQGNAPMSQARQDALKEARRLLISASRGKTSEEDLISGLTSLAKTQKIEGPVDNALAAVKSGPTKYQTDPGQLYGIRQSITDMLSPLARGTDSDARLAARELQKVTASIDNVIEKAAPGYKDYLNTYSDLSKPIDTQKYLQKLNLTDSRGNITLAKVDNALKRIEDERSAAGTRPAKSIPDDVLSSLYKMRADLAREGNSSLGKSIGSNTFQNLATNNILGNLAGPLSLVELPHNPLAGLALGAGKLIYGSKNDEILNRLVNKMTNPSEGAVALAPPAPGRGQYVNALLQGVSPYAVPAAIVMGNRLAAPRPALPESP